MPTDQVQYSQKYYDSKYEYRHVIVSADLAKKVPKSHLMNESEWRNLGVQQSPGWVHYMMHTPEPHVLLFRRVHSNGAPPGAPAAASAVVVAAAAAAAASAASSARPVRPCLAV